MVVLKVTGPCYVPWLTSDGPVVEGRKWLCIAVTWAAADMQGKYAWGSLEERPEGKGGSSTEAASRPALRMCLELGELLKKDGRRQRTLLVTPTDSEVEFKPVAFNELSSHRAAMTQNSDILYR